MQSYVYMLRLLQSNTILNSFIILKKAIIFILYDNNSISKYKKLF